MVRTIEDVDRDITQALGAGNTELYKLLLDEKKLLTDRHKPQEEATELPPEDPRVQFWRNLPHANLVDGPGGYKELHLQQGTYFLGRGSKRASMLLPPCYSELWDLVCKGEGSNNFIITGTPGIGKTVWQYYAMYHLAKAGETVVMDFKGFSKCICFSRDSVRVGHLTAFDKELEQESTWYLVDTREPEDAEAKTILTSSPNRDVYKEFEKRGALKLFMPVWTWPELDAGRHLYGLTQDEILPLYEKWGGTARYVLHLAKSDAKLRVLESAFAKADLTAIYRAVGEVDSADEVSHRLLHILVEPNYLDTGMIFASEYVGRKVGEQFCKGKEVLLELQGFISATAGRKEYNDVRGKLFEALAHCMLGAGGSFDVRDLKTGKEETLYLERSPTTIKFHDLKEVAKQEAGTYCIPSRSDQGAIDSIQQPKRLFQMMVADHHSINATGLSNAVDAQSKDSKTDPELFFVVSPDQFSTWGKKQKYTGRTDLLALRTVRQRVLKLPLEMMAHSSHNFRSV